MVRTGGGLGFFIMVVGMMIGAECAPLCGGRRESGRRRVKKINGPKKRGDNSEVAAWFSSFVWSGVMPPKKRQSCIPPYDQSYGNGIHHLIRIQE